MDKQIIESLERVNIKSQQSYIEFDSKLRQNII